MESGCRLIAIVILLISKIWKHYIASINWQQCLSAANLFDLALQGNERKPAPFLSNRRNVQVASL
jgi:hypothetical protein